MKKLLREILKEITPTEEEHELEKRIIERIKKKLERMGVRPVLVGSLAKDTDLRGDKDIDIFIMFHKDVSREELEKRALEIGRKLFKELNARYEIDYAEHPYVRGFYRGYNVDIVPCYETKEPRSAVDRTPYHTRYVRKKIRENKNLSDEIRLLKQFMKGIGVYGAEAKVQGFSGYLTELLVINYGSFENTLKAATEWKFNQILDPENLWEDKEPLKYFFPDASLIVIDPIDENRNAAAAVSRQRLAEFIVASIEFLKSPGREFFFPPEEKLPSKEELSQRMRSRGTKLIGILFEHSRINPNSLYPQLRKTAIALKKSIEDFDFRILKSDLWTDENNLSVILLDFEVWRLPRIRHHLGPPIDKNLRDQENFIEKYRAYRPYIKNGRWVVDTERKFKRIEELLPGLIEEKKGFGKNLRGAKEIEIIEDRDILKIDNEGFLRFMDGFLSPL